MRKSLILAVSVLFLTGFPFCISKAQTGSPKAYFGLSSGYAYQKLDSKGSLTIGSVTVTNVEVKENGFYLAPKLGVFLGESSFALEFEPRWTVSSSKFDVTGTSGGANVMVTVDGETLNHILLPALLVLKAGNGSVEFNLGVGTGVNFYDVGDKISATTSIPFVGKLGFGFSVSERATIGIDGQFVYSLWTNDNSIDDIWGLSIGPKLEVRF